MKQEIVYISGYSVASIAADESLSFEPFLDYIEQVYPLREGYKATLCRELLEQATKLGIRHGSIAVENLGGYADFLEYAYSLLSPPVVPEHQHIWGMGAAISPMVFYGTVSFYQIIERVNTAREVEIAHNETQMLLYATILKRLYHFPIPVDVERLQKFSDSTTGQTHYYRIEMNMDFVEISAKGQLPEVNVAHLYTMAKSGNILSYLQQHIPLHHFYFRGMTVFTVTDVTPGETIKQIEKQSIESMDPEAAFFDQLLLLLQMLVQDGLIELDLLPFIRVNGKVVQNFLASGSGLIRTIWQNAPESQEFIHQQINDYASAPVFVYYSDLGSKEWSEDHLAQKFRQCGIGSAAIIPLFADERPVGILLLHTIAGRHLEQSTLLDIEPALPALSRIFEMYIDRFHNELELEIKNKFTAIQPSIQWKFYEIAWSTLYHKKHTTGIAGQELRFTNLFPLYGAIDIRNSGIERNNAALEDTLLQLEQLQQLVNATLLYERSFMMKMLSDKCEQWLIALKVSSAGNEILHNVERFLHDESREMVRTIVMHYPALTMQAQDYLNKTATLQGAFEINKLQFENSLQQINTLIAGYLEGEIRALQQHYPFYFERFRTDGIEYDIYIGQAICPDKEFTSYHIKHLRMWQLQSMIQLATDIHALSQKLPRSLQTTQLIFVHDHRVDICFREDEKRFDVEGGYNIRYQLIKKRIDKACIKGTRERITQPGMVAIVYATDADVSDYLSMISYLENSGRLTAAPEHHELEELQGVDGLKAIRIKVC